MNAPKKPREAPAPAAEFTAMQMRVAQLFAALDDRRQQEAIVKLTRMVATHPRHAAPALRLVGGAR
jgi:hypothetical protein